MKLLYHLVFPLYIYVPKLKSMCISFIIVIETTGCLPGLFPFTFGQKTKLSVLFRSQMSSDQLWKEKY